MICRSCVKLVEGIPHAFRTVAKTERDVLPLLRMEPEHFAQMLFWRKGRHLSRFHSGSCFQTDIYVYLYSTYLYYSNPKKDRTVVYIYFRIIFYQLLLFLGCNKVLYLCIGINQINAWGQHMAISFWRFGSFLGMGGKVLQDSASCRDCCSRMQDCNFLGIPSPSWGDCKHVVFEVI